MRSLFESPTLVRLLSQIISPNRRRPCSSFRTSLENLESRALLSAVGGECLLMASDVQDIQAPQQAKAAIPRIDGVAGTFSVSGGNIGNGSLTITQQGQQISGTFQTSNLNSGSFQAQFKSAKARVAKGTAEFVFAGEQTEKLFNFTIRFKKSGSFNFSYHTA